MVDGVMIVMSGDTTDCMIVSSAGTIGTMIVSETAMTGGIGRFIVDLDESTALNTIDGSTMIDGVLVDVGESAPADTV